MHWKAPLAGVGLLAGAALTGVASDFLAGRAALEAVNALFAQTGALTTESIIAKPLGGELRLRGLAWRDADARIRIDALTLSARTPFAFLVGAARAAAKMASAENITIETGFATYKIKRLDLSGTSLSNAELGEIIDPKNPAPIAQRLEKISASAVAIPELIAEIKLGSMVQKIVYHDISLSDIVKGKIAAASAEGASFSVSGPDGDGAQGAYGQMSAKAIDLVLAARIMTETRKSPDEPKMPLYDSFSVDGFYFSDAKSHIELDVKRLAGRGIKGRPPRQLWSALMEGGSSPPERKKRDVLLVADLLDAFEIDQAEANDLRLSTRQDGQPVSLFLANLAIGQFSGARVEAVNGQMLTLAGETAKIGIADFTFGGVDLKTLRGAFSEPAPGQSDAGAGALAKAAIPSSFKGIVFNKISVNVADKQGVDSAFKAERFELVGSGQQGGAPARIDVALDHLTIGLSQAEEGSFKDLSEMGYSQLDLSSRLEIAFDEAKRELAIGTLSLEGAGMGAVKISGLFSNVTKALLSQDRVVAAAAALGAILKKIDLRIENTGLFEKAILLQARNQNKSADEVRQTYITDAAVLLPALLENGPAAREIGAALAKFVAKPKSFHFVAVAPSGLGAGDLTLMQTPGALLKKLEIEASANE
jgi:hypothetical protein